MGTDRHDYLTCDRCGQTPAIVLTFCAECGPIPLCGDCTTAHVVEIEDEQEPMCDGVWRPWSMACSVTPPTPDACGDCGRPKDCHTSSTSQAHEQVAHDASSETAAAHAKKAHMLKLALASSKARRKRKEARG